jgi:hypothetical protein
MLELLFTPARTWSSTACILGKVTIDKSPFAFSSELIDFPNMTANIPLMAIFPNELRGNCSACLPPYENNALSSRVLWANAAPFQNVMLILHFRLRKEAQSMFQIPSPQVHSSTSVSSYVRGILTFSPSLLLYSRPSLTNWPAPSNLRASHALSFLVNRPSHHMKRARRMASCCRNDL